MKDTTMSPQTTSAKSALSAFRWDSDLLEFEVAHNGAQLACSVSREALEDAGGGRGASRWRLQEVADRAHGHIAAIVRAKHALAKPNSRTAIHVSTADLNEAGAPPAKATKAR
jgi:hypothetical protein